MTKPPQVGAIIYKAFIDENKRILYTEYTLRTVRTYKHNATKYFWVQKIKNVSWVKKSNKHHDWGWADYIHKSMKLTTAQRDPWTGRRTKLQALLKLRTHTISCIKYYKKHKQHDVVAEFEAELYVIDRALERMRMKNAK